MKSGRFMDAESVYNFIDRAALEQALLALENPATFTYRFTR